MKRFKFKFDVVMQVRKARENETLRVLSEAQKAYQETLRNKQHWQLELSKALKRGNLLGEKQLSIVEYTTEQSYIQGVKQKIIQSDQAIMRANKTVEKALRSYLHARKQIKAVETLHEHAYEEFRKEQSKKEQKEIEDLNIIRSRFREDKF